MSVVPFYGVTNQTLTQLSPTTFLSTEGPHALNNSVFASRNFVVERCSDIYIQRLLFIQ